MHAKRKPCPQAGPAPGNMLSILLGIAALAATGIAARPADAQTALVSSTFGAGADGWTVVDLPAASGLTPPIIQDGGPFSPTYHSTGGNPGGYVSIVDPDSNYYYWYAPTKFLDDQAAAYGGTLSFDERDTYAGSVLNPRGEDVILVGTGGVTISHDLALPSTTTFTQYTITLNPTGWTNIGTGQGATAADMQSALGSLSGLYIFGDFQNGGDTSSLDNVTLSSAPAPEPSQTAAIGIGVLSLAALTLKAHKRRAT